MQREVVCVKDIMILTGRCNKWCKRRLNKMHLKYGKYDYQFITAEEAADDLGLPIEKVKGVLK